MCTAMEKLRININIFCSWDTEKEEKERPRVTMRDKRWNRERGGERNLSYSMFINLPPL